MSQDTVRALARACRVENGEDFHLSDHAPDRSAKGLDKDSAQDLLVAGVKRLSELQDRLYAQDRHAVLAIFQAMDAGGKDGVIKHVFSGVNPQGCQVTSFKAPGPEELDHDFLWRHQRALPARGQIGIHNRSWYEEVLVARVHPAVLTRQGLPPEVITPAIWDERLEDIAAFERYLARQGFVVLKFFLNLSKEEQARRFLARIDTPAKNWKLAEADIEERQHWDAYRAAYDTAIRATAQPKAPWYVVPADRKWLTRLLVVDTMVQALEALDPQYPSLDAAELERLERARKRLQAE
jgi:PPK2 family polyphosphate:nucleotide phosphotransferase